MAGKTTDMSKIKQVMMLHAQGYSNRKISRELNLDKCTVNTYVKYITEERIDTKALLAM